MEDQPDPVDKGIRNLRQRSVFQRGDRQLVLALMLCTCGQNRVFAQECPSASATGPSIESQVRTLEGRLVFHNGIRQWFELKLDRPQCGQSSIQLVPLGEKYRDLEVLRECRVKSGGAIEFSPTGYYSLDIFQDVRRVEPVGLCSRQPRFPDYSGAKPDKQIHTYTVDMHVIYKPGDHPIVFHVLSAGRELAPWQAYASYMLTGGFALYGYCGDGFVVDKVFGTPEAHPGHFDVGIASFDPESAAQSNKWNLHLGYTCIRNEPRSVDHESFGGREF